MPRKTAAAVKMDQPDLLGGAPQTAKPEPKAKPKAVVQKGDDPKPEIAKPAVNKGQLALVKNNPTNTLAVLVEAMSKKDAANLQIVAALHKEMVAEQARIDFIVAFHAMKRELPRINKDGKIEILEKGADGKRVAGRDKVQQATPYATYDGIREAVDPILDRHGFTMWDETEPSPDGTRLLVITHLDHVSGHGRRSVFPVPAEVSGSKNNVQGWGSSNSYGKRYGALNLLNLRTKAPEDRDLDGNKAKVTKAGKPVTSKGEVLVEANDEPQVEVCSEEQIARVREAIEVCGVPDETFLKHFQIKKLSQLSAADYADALAACRTYAEKRKGA